MVIWFFFQLKTDMATLQIQLLRLDLLYMCEKVLPVFKVNGRNPSNKYGGVYT